MLFQNVFNQILVLFLVVLAGAAARKLNAVGDEFNKYLTDFILNISLPALLISSMRMKYSSQMIKNAVIIFIISAVVYALSIVLVFLITWAFRIKDERKNLFRFMLIFPNIGFMGYPVINVIFGNNGMFYAAIFNLTFSLVVWTVGIIIINGGRKGNSAALSDVINPGIIAILIGLLMFTFSIPLPSPVSSAIDLIGSTATPLSMILIGFMLGNCSIKQILSSPMVFIMSIFRLIIIPLFFLIILKPFISDNLILGVSIIMTAMPAATLMQIFTGKYGGDEYTSSQCIFISTLLSIFTIPLIALILKA